MPGDCFVENKLIERLYYFGWVWEPEYINEVTVATKDDEAKIDVYLLAIGVKGKNMEKSHYLLRNLLFRWWIRNLTL